jgi:phytoene dehydrogenase-like protein
VTPGAAAYDAIVVGGGHNGLVCAAYLARGGLRTLLLERRDEVGGMAGTSEIVPGVRVPALAHTVGRLRPSVARDLSLRDHGLSLVQPDVRAFAPQADGRHITLWTDAGRTCADLVESGLVSPRDAAEYPAADGRLRTLAAALGTLMTRTPPDLTHASLGDTLEGVKAGLLARTRANSESGGLLRVLPMAVADLVGEWFESDALRAIICARAVQYSALGPRMPGTAQLLLADAAGSDGGLAGQSVFARGGPGALAAALASAARRLGVDVRTDAEVVRVRHAGERVRGVVLASGEEVDAPVVVSGLDPKQTLLRLIPAEVLGPRLSWRAGNIRQRGVTAKVNLALAGLPAFTGLDPAAAAIRLRGRIVFAPGMRALERATDAAKYGRMVDEPFLEATIPSLIDPGLVDAAGTDTRRHVMSIIVQSAPYDLRAGGWDEHREELGDKVVRTLEMYAPGIGGLVEGRQVITPLDLERDYGATEGHALHAEAGLDQWFAWRPLHGLGRYRMPLGGLYLCGSGAHPGGGITGGPGQIAAREVLADARHAPALGGHGRARPPDGGRAAVPAGPAS